MSKEALKILSNLKSEGLRMTAVRKLLIDILVTTKQPLSVAEIISALTKKGRSVNKTTVYREVESLLKVGAIRDVNLMDGQMRYELRHAAEDHPHIVCTACEKIQCLPIPEEIENLHQRITKKIGFEVTGHVLEFFGVCSDCRS